jgi:hypothetical protein
MVTSLLTVHLIPVWYVKCLTFIKYSPSTSIADYITLSDRLGLTTTLTITQCTWCPTAIITERGMYNNYFCIFQIFLEQLSISA